MDLLHARHAPSVRTSLIKVVSHTGLHGNDEADKGAAAVALDEKPADVTETADSNPHASHWWPTFQVPRDDGSTDTHYVSDLNLGAYQGDERRMLRWVRQTHAVHH